MARIILSSLAYFGLFFSKNQNPLSSSASVHHSPFNSFPPVPMKNKNQQGQGEKSMEHDAEMNRGNMSRNDRSQSQGSRIDDDIGERATDEDVNV